MRRLDNGEKENESGGGLSAWVVDRERWPMVWSPGLNGDRPSHELGESEEVKLFVVENMVKSISNAIRKLKSLL